MCVHEGKKLTNGYRSKLVLRKILRKEKWCKIPFFIVPFDTHSRLLTEFYPFMNHYSVMTICCRLFLLMNSSHNGLGGSFINIHFFLILSLITGGLLFSTIADGYGRSGEEKTARNPTRLQGGNAYSLP